MRTPECVAFWVLTLAFLGVSSLLVFSWPPIWPLVVLVDAPVLSLAVVVLVAMRHRNGREA